MPRATWFSQGDRVNCGCVAPLLQSSLRVGSVTVQPRSSPRVLSSGCTFLHGAPRTSTPRSSHMVMPISNSLSSTAAAPLGTKPPEQVHAFRQLGQALRAGDIDAAKQAYASVVRNAPEGASWNPDGPFAQLGKALADGDVDTAKS